MSNVQSEKKVEVDSITVKIGGRSIPLSLAEAKKLKEALNELFGKTEVVREGNHHCDRWYWPYRYSGPTWQWSTKDNTGDAPQYTIKNSSGNATVGLLDIS